MPGALTLENMVQYLGLEISNNCHSICFFWLHYFIVKPYGSFLTFRVNLLGIIIFTVYKAVTVAYIWISIQYTYFSIADHLPHCIHTRTIQVLLKISMFYEFVGYDGILECFPGNKIIISSFNLGLLPISRDLRWPACVCETIERM